MSIWRKNVDIYKLDPLTEDIISKAEKTFNIILPKSYLALLQEQNGGYIRFNSFPTSVPTTWADDHVGVEYIFGIGEQHSILESDYFIQEWGLPKNIVLLSGDGHMWIAFDYRKTNENPPVIYIEDDGRRIVPLADSFDNFLAGLYIRKEEAVTVTDEVIVEEWSLEELIEELYSNDVEKIILTYNYIYSNPNQSEHMKIIEQSLVDFIQNSNDQLKEIAALYFTHFYQFGVLSSKSTKTIKSLLRKDEKLKGYLTILNK